MKNLEQILDKLKPSFIEALDEQLLLYTTIGSSLDESPMWIQLNPMRATSDKLVFQNSQKSQISFMIDCPVQDKRIINTEYMDAYDYFKYVKYMHIRQHYIKVWDELATGINGNRIINFLLSYKLAA
jgi:hypothetical protein